jgi:hypothetical protein
MTPTQHDHDDAPRPAAGRSGASRVGCARREHHTGLDASRPVGPVGATAGGYRDSGPGDDWPSDDVPATCHTTRPALAITTTLPPRVGPLAKSITHTRSVTPPMLCGTLRDDIESAARRALSTHDDRHLGKNEGAHRARGCAPAARPPSNGTCWYASACAGWTCAVSDPDLRRCPGQWCTRRPCAGSAPWCSVAFGGG